MKLFDDFEAVKFPEENLILITNNGYLYYIYNSSTKLWRKYKSSEGLCQLTVQNYKEISRPEMSEAMGGRFPNKETDFMRMCSLQQLWIRELLLLLREDFPSYMADYDIYDAVQRILDESGDMYHIAYKRTESLLKNAEKHKLDNTRILDKVKMLASEFFGRDIFKKEIGITDGHNSSSYFWIRPVRVIDYSDSDSIDSVLKMASNEISIEEEDVFRYLKPFFYKTFDDELKANKNRKDASGFEWYLTHNFFTYNQISEILKDINDTIATLICGNENEFIDQIKGYNAEAELLIDFYRRFIYRMEYMMKVGKEKGYDLISVMGP